MGNALTPTETALRKYASIHYPRHTWYIIVGTIGAAVFLNVFSILWAWRRRHALLRPASDSVPAEPLHSSGSQTGKISVRRVSSALLTGTRIFMLRWHVPVFNSTVFEVLLMVVYTGIILMYTFINTFSSVKVWESRAADLVCAQLPLIVALSTKNNVIQFLTGISHEKLGMLHRTISRVALLLTWIHLWGVYSEGTPYKSILSQTWRWMGLFSGAAQTLLTFLSIRPIRRFYYEFFHLTHIVLVLIFLVTAYIHCSGVGSPFPRYIWPCFLIWGADRLCRYIRFLVLSNFHAPNKSPAKLELVSEDTIRVSVLRRFPRVPPFLGGWKAGQHVFLAFPTIGPIESHPFTIASVAEPQLADFGGKEGVDNVKRTSDNEFEMVWFVRIRNGLTRRLEEHILTMNKHKIELGLNLNEPLACTLPVFMDGPYGAPPDNTPFETCVFIAGGTGVTFTLPRMRDIVGKVAQRAACAKRIIFVWAIRDSAHLKWISNDLSKTLSSAPPGLDIAIAVYVTGLQVSELKLTCSDSASGDTASADEPQSPTTSYDEKESISTLFRTTGITPNIGRPDVHAILEGAVTTSEGPVSVEVAGPDSLQTAVRHALSAPFAGPRNVLRGAAPTVQLHVESFSM